MSPARGHGIRHSRKVKPAPVTPVDPVDPVDPGTGTGTGVPAFRASSVDGAGFQQAQAVSDPAFGHTAGLAVGSSDVAGYHLSTDRGDSWTQSNKGLLETWHKKGVAVAFDRHAKDCVLAYFSNAVITETLASQDVGKKAGLAYGVIDVAKKSIQWKILIDEVVGAGPAYPNNLYVAAAEGPNGTTARQTGRMLVSDPNHANRWYVGTRQGLQVITLTRGASGVTAATVANLSRNAIGAAGERDQVTGVRIGPESTSTNTVVYFTVREGGINGGLNRVTGAGPSQTASVARLGGTNGPTAAEGAEGVAVELENGLAVAYVASGPRLRRWNQTTANTTTGTWTVCDPPAGSVDLRLHAVSTARIGAETRVLTAHYSKDGAFIKIWSSENGGAAWTGYGKSRTSIKIAGGSVDWWLVFYKPYYQPSELAGEGGWDCSQIDLWPDDPKRALASGRSGFWKTNDLLAAGAIWHPAVRGLKATVANWCAPNPSVPGQVVFGDVDWATILVDDGAVSTRPVLDEGQLGSPTYGIDWYGDSYVRGQGDRDDPTNGGIVHVAAPFGANPVRTKLGGFGVDRVFGVAQGKTAGGVPVVLGAVENVGIQRREGAIGTTAGTFTTASATAAPLLQQKFKCPMVWPGDKKAGTNGPNVYAYIARSGTAGGIWRSTNYGVDWTQPLAFTTNERVAAQLIFDPANLERLYFTRDDGAAGTTGVYRVESASTAFTATRILTLTQPGPIALDPRNGRLYAIADPTDAGGGRVLYTDNPTAAAPAWTTIVDPFIDSGMGTAHHMAIDGAGRVYIADFTGGYLVGDPTAATTPTPTPTGAVKAVPVGFTDRWGQSPASAGVAGSSYASVVKNAVAKVDWADLQPTDGATPSLDIFTKDDTNAHSTTSLREMIASVKAAGGKIRLRVMAGVYAPGWVKSIGGSPMPWFDDRTTAGSTTGNSFTIGRWWHTTYRQKYADLQVKLAALLDAEPTIADVTIVGTMTVYSEPMIRQMSDPTIYTPNNRQTLLDTASEAQPYSKDIDIAALKASIDAHKVWKQTHSSLAVNPYQYVVSISSAPSSDTATTTSIMDYCFTSLGKLAAFGNHSIRDNQQPYDEATGAGEGGNMVGYNESNIGVVYPKMKTMRDLGCAVYFQTDVPRRTGRLFSTTPQALTTVTVNWNDGAGPRQVLGGPAADLALHFGGTDLELPRNYDPESPVSATYPTAAKFASVAQANAYITAFGGGAVAPPPPPEEPAVTNTRTVTQFLYAKGLLAPLRKNNAAVDSHDHVYPDWGSHELMPGGFVADAKFDWRHGARPGVEGPVWPVVYETKEWQYHNAWLECIPADGGMPAAHRNCRFQISIPKVHHYVGATGQWAARKSDSNFTNLNGGYWLSKPYDKKIDWPSTSPNPYWRPEAVGWSVDMMPTVLSDGQPNAANPIAHGFWPSAFSTRQLISGAQDHVSVLAWMRLIPGAAGVDVSQARYLGRVSCDVFIGPTGSNVLADGRVVNPAMGHSRLLRLTAQWKPVGWITGDEDEVRAIVKNHPLLGQAAPPD